MIEIIALQEHVGKFGVADPDIAVFHARSHAFFGHHGVYGEVLADISKETKEAHWGHPASIVDELGGIRYFFIEVQDGCQLLLYGGDIRIEGLLCEQLTLCFLARRVADTARGATCQRNRKVTAVLEAPERYEGNEIAYVQAVCCRIEASVQADRTFFKSLGKFLRGRAIVDKPSPLEFFQNRHKDDGFGEFGATCPAF